MSVSVLQVSAASLQVEHVMYNIMSSIIWLQVEEMDNISSAFDYLNC